MKLDKIEYLSQVGQTLAAFWGVKYQTAFLSRENIYTFKCIKDGKIILIDLQEDELENYII